MLSKEERIKVNTTRPKCGECAKMVRYVREFTLHKKGTSWQKVIDAYEGLSDETRKTIEGND